MLEHYKLDDDNNPVLCSLREWADMYQTDEGNERRRVAFDVVDGYEISTVFLGLDHGFGSSKPMLFETMVFGKGTGDQYQSRCSTWKEAEDMHQETIQWIKDGCKDE